MSTTWGKQGKLKAVNTARFMLQSRQAHYVMTRMLERAAELGCEIIMHDEIIFTGTPAEQEEKSATLTRELWQGRFAEPR